jgi:hypothetical protein
MQQQDYDTIQNFIKYSSLSMGQCVQEAEKSVVVAGKILEIVTLDVGRVSKMSDDTLKILEDIRTNIESAEAKSHSNTGAVFPSNSSVRDLIVTLRSFSKDNSEIQNLIMPIVESLQFQDRVRQQMENVVKMFPIWLEARNQIENGIYPAGDWESATSEFGLRLLKCTVTKEEREELRNIIPSLPPEEERSSAADSDDFFL